MAGTVRAIWASAFAGHGDTTRTRKFLSRMGLVPEAGSPGAWPGEPSPYVLAAPIDLPAESLYRDLPDWERTGLLLYYVIKPSVFTGTLLCATVAGGEMLWQHADIDPGSGHVWMRAMQSRDGSMRIAGTAIGCCRWCGAARDPGQPGRPRTDPCPNRPAGLPAA
jgi:hypothetical protein